MQHRFKVNLAEAGMTLQAFLRKHLGLEASVKAIKRSIDSRRCFVNKRLERISTKKLKEKDLVEIDIVPHFPKKPLLLYEDDYLALYDKPSGIASEPKNFPGKLVHRLDKETSGVLLLAKTEKAREALISLFEKRAVEKTYLAVVDGVMKKKEGEVDIPLERKKEMVFAAKQGRGKEAKTLWRLKAVGDDCSFLLCKPVTGRTHQIRVHLKEIGHPILGDTLYGKTFRCRYRPYRHLLHAARIAFDHPFLEKRIEVEAALPLDFIEALKAAGMPHAVQLAGK